MTKQPTPKQLINNANKLLKTLFKDKHTLPITLEIVQKRLKDSSSLLSVDTEGNAKAAKSNKKFAQYLNVILYLVPGDLLGILMCVNFSVCLGGCLFFTGMGGDYKVCRARIIKTLIFAIYNKEFKTKLQKNVTSAKRKAQKNGKQLVLRLNGTSDLHPRRFGIEPDPEIIRYEYTKCIEFAQQKALGVHYTYSFYGTNLAEAKAALAAGCSVAVVVDKKTKKLPDWCKDYPVVDGDEHDLRFLDPKGCIVKLPERKGGFYQSHRRTDLVAA
jgi:hypothetical protein